MSDVAIRAEGLGKRYRIGLREPYKSIRDVLGQAARAPVGRLWSALARRPAVGQQGAAEGQASVWALRNVSFELRHGEVLGVIGPNGAGKTTLLKILSRITDPTEGLAEVYGRVGSLLEVGTGFHPELTGRENIYLNGAILGMRRAEIERRFEEIVEFSGVERFIDTPVKRYSTGMQVRLAFAVAAHLDPEILLIDEVLAVGDAAFQQKCLGKMGQVASSGRTVLFVSHNMAAVRSLCTRAMVLEGGEIRAQGDADAAIEAYLTHGGGSIVVPGRTDLEAYQPRSGSGRVRVRSFWAQGSGGPGSIPATGAEAKFLIDYAAGSPNDLLRLHVAIGVLDELGNNVFGCTTTMTPLQDFRNAPPLGTIVCRLRELPLIPGNYRVNLMLKDDAGLADSLANAARFTVTDSGESGFVLIPTRRWGNVVAPHEWDWLPQRDPQERDLSLVVSP